MFQCNQERVIKKSPCSFLQNCRFNLEGSPIQPLVALAEQRRLFAEHRGDFADQIERAIETAHQLLGAMVDVRLVAGLRLRKE